MTEADCRKVTLTWPGGEHVFFLGNGGLRSLEVATGRGPEEVLGRLRSGVWRVDEIIAVLRLGLMGGGMSREDATRLVLATAELHGLIALKLTAALALAAALMPPAADDEDDETGGSDGRE